MMIQVSLCSWAHFFFEIEIIYTALLRDAATVGGVEDMHHLPRLPRPYYQAFAVVPFEFVAASRKSAANTNQATMRYLGTSKPEQFSRTANQR